MRGLKMECKLPYEFLKSKLHEKDFTLTEVRGGIGKQVFKINSTSDIFMLYLWSKPYEGTLTENIMKGGEYLWRDGYDCFLHNTKLLLDIGIKVPEIINTGFYNINYAIVEYFNGKNVDEYQKNGGNLKNKSEKILEIMGIMDNHTRGWYGSPLIDKANDISSEQLTFNFYSHELEIAANLDEQIKTLQKPIQRILSLYYENIKVSVKEKYGLVHGELTPPHIFILDNGEIGLVDIEGLKYFDKEFDWAVLEMMYDGIIKLPNDIDEKRMDFYKLCLKIGYISVAVDYLKNIDSEHKFFQYIYKENLNYIKKLIKST
jgi:hypothetical protein